MSEASEKTTTTNTNEVVANNNNNNENNDCSSKASDIVSSSNNTDELNKTNNESKVKKRVAILLGYYGGGYAGFQKFVKKPGDTQTVEGVLETAIYKSGGILESNYGFFQKVKWNRNSRTDRGVSSVASVVAMKMEVSPRAWENDRLGKQIAESINAHLVPQIRVFSVQKTFNSFSAKDQCNWRQYEYLLPLSILKDGEGSIDKLNSALAQFEGTHNFRNYTKGKVLSEAFASKRKRAGDDEDPGELDEEEEEEEEEGEGAQANNNNNNNNKPKVFNGLKLPPQWDQMTPLEKRKYEVENHTQHFIHVRTIYKFTCDPKDLIEIEGVKFGRIIVSGQSFMLNQIRKMIGTAVAITNGLLPDDFITLSLDSPFLFVTPLAPGETLLLNDCGFSSRVWDAQPDLRVQFPDEIREQREQFKRDVIYPRIFADLKEKKPFEEWVSKSEPYLKAEMEKNNQDYEIVRSLFKEWQQRRQEAQIKFVEMKKQQFKEGSALIDPLPKGLATSFIRKFSLQPGKPTTLIMKGVERLVEEKKWEALQPAEYYMEQAEKIGLDELSRLGTEVQQLEGSNPKHKKQHQQKRARQEEQKQQREKVRF